MVSRGTSRAFTNYMLEQTDYDAMRRNLKKAIDAHFVGVAASATEAQKAQLRTVWAKLQGNVQRMTNAQLFESSAKQGNLLLQYVASL